jgi:hypothetical protein
MAYTATRYNTTSSTAVALRNDTAILSGTNGGPHYEAAIRAYEEGSITVYGTVTNIQSSGSVYGADFRRFTVSTSKGQFVLVAFSDMKNGIWEATQDLVVGQKVAFEAGPEGWGSNKPRWQGTRRICGVNDTKAAERCLKQIADAQAKAKMQKAFGHTVDLQALTTVRARKYLETSSASWKRFANRPEAYLP